MRWLKLFENFKSDDKTHSGLSHNQKMEEIKDILQDLKDEGIAVEISTIRKDNEGPDRPGGRRITSTDTYLEVYIRRPFGSENRQIPGVANPEGGYPGNLLFWFEIKDTIIRVTEWFYSLPENKSIDKATPWRLEKDQSPLRFFTSGIEVGIGFSKAEDFKFGDFISFTNFRLLIKL